MSENTASVRFKVIGDRVWHELEIQSPTGERLAAFIKAYRALVKEYLPDARVESDSEVAWENIKSMNSVMSHELLKKCQDIIDAAR